ERRPCGSIAMTVRDPKLADSATAESHTGPLLEVRDLVVHYPIQRGFAGAVLRKPRQWVHAVDGVSLSLARGEMLALVGESGCGKTTTGQAILRLVEPRAGTIRVNGRDVTH